MRGVLDQLAHPPICALLCLQLLSLHVGKMGQSRHLPAEV
jgi:hypothetical protein